VDKLTRGQVNELTCYLIDKKNKPADSKQNI